MRVLRSLTNAIRNRGVMLGMRRQRVDSEGASWCEWGTMPLVEQSKQWMTTRTMKKSNNRIKAWPVGRGGALARVERWTK